MRLTLSFAESAFIKLAFTDVIERPELDLTIQDRRLSLKRTKSKKECNMYFEMLIQKKKIHVRRSSDFLVPSRLSSLLSFLPAA